MTRTGHVSLWHPWLDRKGIRHSLTLWHQEDFPSDINSLVAHVTGSQQYVFCNDLLDPLEIPLELLKHEKSEPYMSRTGKVVALRVRAKKSGFFIPASTWGYKREPDERLLQAINEIFRLFEFEGITPSSLSEKILRYTLPEKVYISRPSHMLRKTLLDNYIGGRIDRATKRKYKRLVTYDEVKAYLFHSQQVVSPFHSPIYLLFSNRNDDRYRGYATCYIHCECTAHNSNSSIHPIQVKDTLTGTMRKPREGETIERWLWLEELDDCLQAGYTLEAVYEAYCFPEMSNFMESWANIMWNTYIDQSESIVKDILKQMMVGLPGRFLKSPEVYTLIHESERLRGDIPIVAQWKRGGQVTTPWFLRASFDMESAQLTPVGSYIPMKCRQELYHRMKAEEEAGNTVVSSYIDCYTTTEESLLTLGENKGDWKQKDSYFNVWADENQIIPEDQERMRAPGVSGKFRKALYEMYHSEREGNNELVETTI